ncbi:hypothetical protein [Myroides pelagicus]|uniref:Uncharacterized protein n=1 Tax=Myroides pelagicus TaxID=270914 RepID=A0A7K1GQ74_9FLAO|nr:hypothetical protein [Myroides pelagicus]MTH31055.1 hypothetical protein [Myroides pelagicus]
MKLKLIASILTINLLSFACNRVSEKDITIIDNLVLGKKNLDFIEQYDSLKIPHKTFFAGHVFTSIDELGTSKIIRAYSDKFNLLPQRNIKQYGIYFQRSNEGSDYIVELDVMLGFEGNATLFEEGRMIDVTKETGINSFIQANRKDLIDKIESLLIKKYGKPDEVLVENIPFYSIKNNLLSPHNTEYSYKTELLVWNTDYLVISFFKGLETNSYFSEEGNSMIMFDKSQRNEELISNGIQFNEYPYISYRLNDKTIKKLKLDEIDL